MAKKDNEVFSLRQCGDYGKVTRQAIYVAIRLGKLKASKVNGRWRIRRDDYDHYRLNKYNRDDKKIDGEYVFDMEQGFYSVQQVLKIISDDIGRPYSLQRLYYLIRIGRLKSFRKGYAIVVNRDGAIELLERVRKEESLANHG